jgi:hypothetical protein
MCPECGAAFNPSDPGSMYRWRRVPDAFTARLLQPVGWPMALATIATALVTCWAYTPPGAYSGLLLLCALAWPALAVYWLVRLVARIGNGISFEVGTRGVRELMWWLLPVLIALATALLAQNDVPFRAAFSLSRSAMDRYAASILSNPPLRHTTAPPQRVGLYHVRHAALIGSGMSFEIDAGFMSGVGFAYFPDGPPSAYSGLNLQHIDGPWYTFSID